MGWLTVVGSVISPSGIAMEMGGELYVLVGGTRRRCALFLPVYLGVA